jgi:aldose 1-epimerase
VSAALRLRAGDLEVCVLPGAGGGLAEFNLHRADQKVALFRALPHAAVDDDARPRPDLLACYPLIPWCNRIGHGAFAFDGRRYCVAPTYPTERYPIHGNGWLSKWSVMRCNAHAVKLELTSAIGPFVYTGALEYRLGSDALHVRLYVCNRGDETLPFGLGLHPWFVRTPGVRLRTAARGIWLTGDDLLPIAHAPVPADLDFAQPEPLPARLVDNSFSGWDGTAEIAWEDTGVQLRIETQPRLAYFQLFAPVGRSVFCFEPVTHPADAFNLPAPHAGCGLHVLAPGQAASIEVRFQPSTRAG